MPKTIDRTFDGQIIGGIFTNRENADKAVQALEDISISPEDIEIVFQPIEIETANASTNMLSDRGLSESQANYYEKAVREGKVLVAVFGVTEPAPIIDIFDKFKAEFNPNGSRNLRDDVLGMTAGAVIGSAALGAAGAALGGPVGAVAGVAAGVVLGGGSGAIAGKASEHNK